MTKTEALKAELEAYRNEYPEVVERIRQEVATWGPLPEEAQRLWRAARRQYLASLASEAPES